MQVFDVCIVGGGAAGVSAALFLSQGGFGGSVLILEKRQKLLTKFEYTANGRWNLTNKRIDASCYATSTSSSYVQRVIDAFPSSAAVEWLTGFGLSLVCDEARGRLYPAQQSARVVSSAFVTRLNQSSCQVRFGLGVVSWEFDPKQSLYHLVCDDGSVVCARRVIWAVGGAAAPVFGTDGTWVSQFSDRAVAVEPWCPVLCGLRLARPLVSLSGSVVRCRLRLVLRSDGSLVFDQEGEALWTHFGLSGPVVFDATVRVGAWVTECRAVVELIAPESFDALWASPDKKCVSDLFSSFSPKIKQYFHTLFADVWTLKLSSAPATVKKSLYNVLVSASFDILGLREPNDAQTSRGGVALSEIVVKTGSLKTYPWFYVVGEALDVAGVCGGYNLHFAYASSYYAVRDILRTMS